MTGYCTIPRPSRIGLIALLAVTLVTGIALADETISKKGPAKSDGMVYIENIAGSIQVIGWDQEEVTVTATLRGEAEDLKFETGSKTRIKVVYPRKMKNSKASADLVVHVPKGSSLEVEGVSAGVEVEGVTGEIDAESVSGDVTVRKGGSQIEAESISGDVTVEDAKGDISIGSISGDVTATGGNADVEAESVSGSIGLEFTRFLSLKVESVAGSATVAGALDPEGSVSIELHSGDVILTVPGDVSADFKVETFSGEIDNAFGQKSRRTSKYAPGRELEFTQGNGDTRVRISTFSGNVIIKKK